MSSGPSVATRDPGTPDPPGLGATEGLARLATAVRKVAGEPSEIAAHCVMDWLAAALAGAFDPASRLLRATYLDGPLSVEPCPAGRVTVLGARARLPLLDGVVVNGFAGHVLDFDDSLLEMEGHPSAPVMPALLALAERQGASGAAVLDGVVAGFSVAAVLGAALNPRHYEAGWHATATIGTFAAAAACGNLLGLRAEALTQAFGLASLQASGLKCAFGTMGKPFQVAKAAADGLLSALLAERGMTAPAASIESPQGFAATHASPLGEMVLAELTPSEVMSGVLFKKHASCHSTHPALEALAGLRSMRAVSAAELEQVIVTVGPSVLRICNIERPETGLGLKFSLRATLAMALAGIDTTDPGAYVDETARRPEVLTNAELVEVRIDPRFDAWRARLELVLLGGARLVEEVDLSTRCNDVAAQGVQVRQKFERVVAPLLGPMATERLVAMACSLSELDDVRDLLTLCVPPGVPDEAVS